MAYRILILGASYGSLLGTKLLMAGHDVTLVCRAATAALINAEGTEVRLKLRDETEHRSIFSKELAGKLDAKTPDDVNPSDYDLVALAMQEPQYGTDDIARLMQRIADAKVPCMSIMNMPPLPYLRRFKDLDAKALEVCFADPGVWAAFEPDLVTLCSPDPQAYRPPEDEPNVLHVNLPTNFKAAVFGDPKHNDMLRKLEADIAAVTIEGKDVPVKLRVFDSLFVPFAKWSMLLTGNYRCVTKNGTRSIYDAVHGDIDQSNAVYRFVDDLVQKMGADSEDKVPFEKYANAAKSLSKPSSAARAITGGAKSIERVDRLVQLVGRQYGMNHESVDETVTNVDAALARNQ